MTSVPRQMSSTRKNTQPLQIHIEHGNLKNRKLYSICVNKKVQQWWKKNKNQDIYKYCLKCSYCHFHWTAKLEINAELLTKDNIKWLKILGRTIKEASKIIYSPTSNLETLVATGNTNNELKGSILVDLSTWNKFFLIFL